MLKTILDQWTNDWIHNRLLFWMELIGVSASILSSILISFWPGVISLTLVFSFWLVGSVALAVAAYWRATAWPMVLMTTYTVFNLIGLFNTL